MQFHHTTSSDVPLKRCPKCEQWLPATTEYFALHRSEKSGFQSRCKQCAKQWRAENREKLRADYRRRYDADPGAWARYSRTYIEKTPGKRAADARKRYAANLEKTRANNRKRYARNKAARIKAVRKYAIAHPERVYMLNKKWKRRKMSLPIAFSAEQWQAALSYWQHRCAYCGKPQGFDRVSALSTDHFIPLSSSDCPGTLPTNILPVCRSCNASKGSRVACEWLVMRFGKRKAPAILARIQAYFDAVSP